MPTPTGVISGRFAVLRGWALSHLMMCAVALMSALCTPALGAWSSNSAANNAICTASGSQHPFDVVSDGAGGAIFAWVDNRVSSSDDIYAQRIDASGNTLWTTNGVAVCTATNPQFMPQVASDGAGGAIIVWGDKRSGAEAYAQRINSAGVAQWAANGVLVAPNIGDGYPPRVVPDGSGGAVFAWQAIAAGEYHIFTQRIDSSGTRLWTASGVELTSTGDHDFSYILGDGAGGAFIVWKKLVSSSSDVYAQKVNASGVAQWTANGVGICTATGTQNPSGITSDGSGGAIIVWTDNRGGFESDIYAQRIDGAGATQWTANGAPVTTASSNQLQADVAGTGSGGATFAFQDMRSGDYKLYVQRLDGAGATQWAAGGLSVSSAANSQITARIVSDGSTGAIVSWDDTRTGDYDEYAQRFDSSGSGLWTATGVALSTATSTQFGNRLISDGAGGAIAAWIDLKSGTSDIYAAHVSAAGVLPVCLSGFSVE